MGNSENTEQTAAAELPQNLAGLYENMNAMMKKLKKPTYEKYYQEFREKKGQVIRQIVSFVEQSDDKEAAGHAVGRQLVQDVRTAFASSRGK